MKSDLGDTGIYRIEGKYQLLLNCHVALPPPSPTLTLKNSFPKELEREVKRRPDFLVHIKDA